MQVNYPMPDDHRNMSAQMVVKYANEPHEKDAFEFHKWIEDQYVSDKAKGKIRFSLISSKYTII